MLPAAYKWIELSDGWLLRFNYRGVAKVSLDGAIMFRWHGEVIEDQAACAESARQIVDDWIRAKNDLPARLGEP